MLPEEEIQAFKKRLEAFYSNPAEQKKTSSEVGEPQRAFDLLDPEDLALLIKYVRTRGEISGFNWEFDEVDRATGKHFYIAVVDALKYLPLNLGVFAKSHFGKNKPIGPYKAKLHKETHQESTLFAFGVGEYIYDAFGVGSWSRFVNTNPVDSTGVTKNNGVNAVIDVANPDGRSCDELIKEGADVIHSPYMYKTDEQTLQAGEQVLAYYGPNSHRFAKGGLMVISAYAPPCSPKVFHHHFSEQLFAVDPMTFRDKFIYDRDLLLGDEINLLFNFGEVSEVSKEKLNLTPIKQLFLPKFLEDIYKAELNKEKITKDNLPVLDKRLANLCIIAELQDGQFINWCPILTLCIDYFPTNGEMLYRWLIDQGAQLGTHDFVGHSAGFRSYYERHQLSQEFKAALPQKGLRRASSVEINSKQHKYNFIQSCGSRKTTVAHTLIVITQDADELYNRLYNFLHEFDKETLEEIFKACDSKKDDVICCAIRHGKSSALQAIFKVIVDKCESNDKAMQTFLKNIGYGDILDWSDLPGWEALIDKDYLNNPNKTNSETNWANTPIPTLVKKFYWRKLRALSKRDIPVDVYLAEVEKVKADAMSLVKELQEISNLCPIVKTKINIQSVWDNVVIPAMNTLSQSLKTDSDIGSNVASTHYGASEFFADPLSLHFPAWFVEALRSETPIFLHIYSVQGQDFWPFAVSQSAKWPAPPSNENVLYFHAAQNSPDDPMPDWVVTGYERKQSNSLSLNAFLKFLLHDRSVDSYEPEDLLPALVAGRLTLSSHPPEQYGLWEALKQYHANGQIPDSMFDFFNKHIPQQGSEKDTKLALRELAKSAKFKLLNVGRNYMPYSLTFKGNITSDRDWYFDHGQLSGVPDKDYPSSGQRSSSKLENVAYQDFISWLHGFAFAEESFRDVFQRDKSALGSSVMRASSSFGELPRVFAKRSGSPTTSMREKLPRSDNEHRAGP